MTSNSCVGAIREELLSWALIKGMIYQSLELVKSAIQDSRDRRPLKNHPIPL